MSAMGHPDLIELTNCPRKKACPSFDVIDCRAAQDGTTSETEEDEADPAAGASPF